METKLAIITAVYNHYTLLNDFFFSLNQQNNTNFKLFLSDTSEKKQSIPSQSFALEILNLKNLGYAYAINQGLKKAANSGFNYFCIINDDTYFNKDFVDQALKSLVKYSPALIGGKIYYAPGYEYHKHYNNNLGKVIWYAGGEMDWQNCLTRHIGVDQVDTGQFAQFAPTEFITGCLMLYHKKILETVGFWDEKYFLYYEDADYCQRTQLKGFPLYYDPSIIIYHKNSQSTQGPGSLLHQKYQKKNQLRFGLKYAPWKTKLHLIKNYFLS
jgi:hypothetical protein